MVHNSPSKFHTLPSKILRTQTAVLINSSRPNYAINTQIFAIAKIHTRTHPVYNVYIFRLEYKNGCISSSLYCCSFYILTFL